MDVSISEFFSLHGLFTLGMLVLLQAVLGFDNLLYISLESQRVEADKQAQVRKLGIGLAIFLRLALLVILLLSIDRMKNPLVTIGLDLNQDAPAEIHPANDHSIEHDRQNWQLSSNAPWFAGSFTLHSIIVLFGGIFIIYTAFKEITHILRMEDDHGHVDDKPRSAGAAVFWITLMNLIFSFDSILSAIALTHNVWVMGTAIVVSGILMIWLADHVSEFIKRNRMFEVLGLFILFIVGILLVSEGAHIAHMHLFTYEIQPMAKATFYFVIGILVVVDIIQSRYQKQLLARRAHANTAGA